jgi:hypothetical protein
MSTGKRPAQSGILAAIVSITIAACTSVGPHTLTRDRFDYSDTVADSWKQQTLLNIVKIRYLDPPVFLDVGQIVSGYTVETSGTLGVNLARGEVLNSDAASAGGAFRYTDRPTITYTPMTGDKFLRGLMTPIDPSAVFFMLQSGYAADFVLAMTVESLSGLRNPTSAQAPDAGTGEAFVRALRLLREIQLSGALQFTIETNPDKSVTTILFLGGEHASPEIAAKIEEMRALLKLPQGPPRYRLRHSPAHGAPGELSIQPRSMLQILSSMSTTVEVPPEDLDRVLPIVPARGAEPGLPFLVKWSDEKPDEAYAAVPYRKHWFWIDDSDLRSKRAFGFVMFLFTLANTGSSEQLPVLTIPTG